MSASSDKHQLSFLEQKAVEEVTLVEQITEVERELKLRRGAYPRWVRDGRLTAQAAQDGIRKMMAVKATLEKLWQAAQQS